MSPPYIYIYSVCVYTCMYACYYDSTFYTHILSRYWFGWSLVDMCATRAVSVLACAAFACLLGCARGPRGPRGSAGVIPDLIELRARAQRPVLAIVFVAISGVGLPKPVFGLRGEAVRALRRARERGPAAAQRAGGVPPLRACRAASASREQVVDLLDVHLQEADLHLVDAQAVGPDPRVEMADHAVADTLVLRADFGGLSHGVRLAAARLPVHE